jgi:hypothetical protein
MEDLTAVGIERSSNCAKGVQRLDDVTGLGRLDDVMGSDEAERGWMKRRSVGRLGRLSFGSGFERSKAWAGCDGPWAVIFVLVGSFAMKIEYPILLVPDTWES